MGGWLKFGRGELGWGRRRRNRRRESRQSGYILAFNDGIIDGHFPLVSPPVTMPRHCTEIRFESLGHSVGKIIWKKSTSSHRCNFSKIYIFRPQFGRYIPTVLPTDSMPSVMEKVCRYIPIKLETELCSSVKIIDKKIHVFMSMISSNLNE